MKTREKILAVAQTLFVKKGIDKTSTALICKEVGIASGSLFVDFKTKQDLIDTIYLERKKTSFTVMQNALDFSKSAEDVVLESSAFMVEYYLNNYQDFQFFQMLEQDPVVSEKARKEYKKEVAQSVELIKQWQKEGTLKSIETSMLMDIWWGILCAIIRNLKQQQKTKAEPEQLTVVWEAIGN